MTKPGFKSGLLPEEVRSGTVLFLLYFLALPLAAGPLFDLIERAAGMAFTQAQRNVVLYYLLFALCVICFRSFLVNTTRRLVRGHCGVLRTIALGLVGMYGLDGIFCRAVCPFVDGQVNLNDAAASSLIQDTPHMMVLVVVMLAPFVEEIFFRGLVFGSIRTRSRLAAYVVSCLLFALLHVWQFAVDRQDAAYFVLMLQYLVPGLVLAWAYERTGTLWASVGLHAAYNGLSAVALLA